MPPKVKITKEDIINAAVEIVRDQGDGALNARSVAARLHCSTQPVFSNFDSMEQLRLAVADAAETLSKQYMEEDLKSGRFPPYKASGMSYIRFAREEKNLFRLLYMRDRASEQIPEHTELGDEMTSMVQNNIGLGDQQAGLFHLEMWAFVHGIAVMLATGYLELEEDLISAMLTDAYQGLKKHYEEKKE